MSLTRSLKNLPKFTSLDLSCCDQSSFSDVLQYTNAGIKIFFNSVNAVKTLEEFGLSWQQEASKKLVFTKELVILCMALRNLRQLPKFHLQIYDAKGLLISQSQVN